MPARRAASSSAAAGTASAAAAPAHTVARLVSLPAGFYALGLAPETSWREPVTGFALPAVHVCAPPDRAAGIEITDPHGRAGGWLGGRRKAVYVKAPAGGCSVLVTAYLARDPRVPPLGLEIRQLDAPWPTAGSIPVATLELGGPGRAAAPPWPSLEVIAHIRGRGDIRFIDPDWVGRLGRGQWIEAFAILPHDEAVAAAIEYKGLSASGAETAWLGSGEQCGARQTATPLIGFAVRSKAVPGRARLDCEYTGYFSSGVTAGPMRNGAPCRSARDNDPLEGLRLRFTERAAPAPAAERQVTGRAGRSRRASKNRPAPAEA